jgi:hypothetical protein
MIMSDEIENCPRMVKKRFIADAEMLLDSLENKGEVDRRLAEMYGTTEKYAATLRLLWVLERKDKNPTHCVGKQVFNSDGVRQEQELHKIKDPEVRAKVEEKLEEVREKKKEMGLKPKVTIEETKGIIKDPDRPIKIPREKRHRRPIVQIPDDKPYDLINSYEYNIQTHINDIEELTGKLNKKQKQELASKLDDIIKSISNLIKKIGG